MKSLVCLPFHPGNHGSLPVVESQTNRLSGPIITFGVLRMRLGSSSTCGRNRSSTNHVVGAAFANDPDGNAWGDSEHGLPPALAKNGYKLIHPPHFQTLTDNFSAQISAFKEAGAEIITGNMIPPDFTTFWTQARQQGLRPKICTITKALLFPSSVESVGQTANNLSTEVWWSPTFPFKSSLSGQSASQLAAAYTRTTGKQWTQPIGFVHSLFEVAADIVKRSADAQDPAANLDALIK